MHDALPVYLVPVDHGCPAVRQIPELDQPISPTRQQHILATVSTKNTKTRQKDDER